MKDLMGKAIWDFYHDDGWENLLTETTISELDDLPVEYLFRDFDGMNKVEQKAVDMYFSKLNSLLEEDGQILIDSTDILYMYERDEDGGIFVPSENYYGELDYWVHYKGDSEEPIKWLYLDFVTLKNAAENNGFQIERVLQEDDSYLARITKK